MRSCTPSRLLSVALLLGPLAACGGGDSGSATDASTGAGTAGNSTTSGATADSTGSTEPTGSSGAPEPTGGPDPDFMRVCQPGDFVCDDWGCPNPPDVKGGECYKPCTPTAVGEPDVECDEPQRPFCSQVGLSFGGDFDCNGCAHICVSAPIDQCGQDVDQCG